MTGEGGCSAGARPTRLIWHDSHFYAPLRFADESAFAWEWLRRTTEYQLAWSAYRSGQRNSSWPRAFGLERFENPQLGVPLARAIWTGDIYPAVIRASVLDPLASEKDRVDLRLLADLVTLVVDENEVEHILLSDGYRFLRLDIVDGTLIGCPSALAYALHGLSQIKGPTAALNRLASLVTRGCFETSSHRIRRDRWIQELRVADALSAGAHHQEIARVLFGGLIPVARWRATDSSFRQRVQRLARTARKRLQKPLDPQWFV